jgi:hypothetical protein
MTCRKTFWRLLQPLVFQPRPGMNSRLPEADLQLEAPASAVSKRNDRTIFNLPER